jgi:hypothetical protein
MRGKPALNARPDLLFDGYIGLGDEINRAFLSNGEVTAKILSGESAGGKSGVGRGG